jgi:hypothetical protein
MAHLNTFNIEDNFAKLFFCKNLGLKTLKALTKSPGIVIFDTYISKTQHENFIQLA